LDASEDEIRGVRVERSAQHAEICAQGPNQLTRSHYRATEYVTRPRSVLGQAVNEHVDVVLTVLMQPGESIVHDHESAGRFGEPRDRRDVGDLGHGIGRTL